MTVRDHRDSWEYQSASINLLSTAQHYLQCIGMRREQLWSHNGLDWQHITEHKGQTVGRRYHDDPNADPHSADDVEFGVEDFINGVWATLRRGRYAAGVYSTKQLQVPLDS